ncbi:hypothetical protein BC829DRAFT_378371 [Chytridium lagenaria]|nr:hypothetical protein BC829DRAFT_378371 [Chytridium lagenaria]
MRSYQQQRWHHSTVVIFFLAVLILTASLCKSAVIPPKAGKNSKDPTRSHIKLNRIHLGWFQQEQSWTIKKRPRKQNALSSSLNVLS